jgi:hypothetical protein
MHIPTIGGMIIPVLFQLLILAALVDHILRDLRRDCSKRLTLTTLFTGLLGGILLRLVVLLIADNSAYGSACRTFYSNVFPTVAWSKHLPDAIWVIADFIQSGGPLFCGGAGAIVLWLVTRAWVRGSRATRIKTFGTILVVALFVLWIWIAPHFSSRYQAEDESLASLASLFAKPVQYQRVEGVSGLQYVNYVFVPQCTITDDLIGSIVAQLRRFPRLVAVDVMPAKISDHGLKQLRDALPNVGFGSIGSSGHDKMEMRPRIDEPPPHAMIEQAYYYCNRCDSLEGGNYGKGPFKSLPGKGKTECVHDWKTISHQEFKKLATEKHGVDWSKEIPFWQRD